MRRDPTLPARPHRAPGVWRRGVLLVALGVGLALLAASDTLHGALLRALAAAEPLISAHPVAGAGLFVLLAALSAMLAFFSSAVIVPIALYTWGKALTVLLLWAGWLLGGSLAYGVGRFLGRPVVSALTSGEKLAHYEERISTRTPFSLVLLFQVALPSEVPGYLLGLVRYRFLRYLAALGLAELPFALGTVYLGAGFLRRQYLLLVALGLLGALGSAWALVCLRRRLAD